MIKPASEPSLCFHAVLVAFLVRVAKIQSRDNNRHAPQCYRFYCLHMQKKERIKNAPYRQSFSVSPVSEIRFHECNVNGRRIRILLYAFLLENEVV